MHADTTQGGAAGFSSKSGDLQRMGCEKFLDLPWDFTDDSVLYEVAIRSPVKEFRGDPVRAQPEAWTELHWRATYDFPNCPNGFDLDKNDRLIRKKFRTPPPARMDTGSRTASMRGSAG